MVEGRIPRCFELLFSVALLVASLGIPSIAAAQDDLDEYKVRITGLWFHSSPTVSLEAAGHNGLINFNNDFHFNTYSTFIGKFDWKFTRKNHLYFVSIPFSQSKEAVLNRTIVFRGQTFNVGALTKASLNATVYAPGYQYDIIRRSRGHLGIGVQFNFFDVKGSMTVAAQVTSTGINQVATTAQSSLRAPIPVAGPEAKFYLTKSPRIFVQGNVYGMYFFGYGNYLSTVDNVGLEFGRHFGVTGGYALGSRLNVNTTSQRVGLSLSQKGPVVGAEVSF